MFISTRFDIFLILFVRVWKLKNDFCFLLPRDVAVAVIVFVVADAFVVVVAKIDVIVVVVVDRENCCSLSCQPYKCLTDYQLQEDVLAAIHSRFSDKDNQRR